MIIQAEYEFLRGNTEYWTGWGSAYGQCMEYLKENGYGDFGRPTQRGAEACKAYERNYSSED